MKTRFSKLTFLLIWSMVMIMTSQPLFADDTFHRTTAQKGVKTSTDVILVALPAAALTGVLIEKDWQGLKQGALTAVTSVGATYI
ncbi:MAG: hypothetical protein K2M10_04910, partial [Muribaculaceae bacterium]|nr:hypothetical protein [Muribaculaceae bacterium]